MWPTREAHLNSVSKVFTHRTGLSYSDPSLPGDNLIQCDSKHPAYKTDVHHKSHGRHKVSSLVLSWGYTQTLLSGRILQGFIGDFPGSELRAHSRDPRTSRMWEAQAHSVSLFCTAPSHCFRHLSQLNYSYYLSSVFNLSWPSTQFSDMRSALISEDFSLLPYTYNYFVPFLCESIS